jgi:lysophospholipase L1-like esterase
MTNNATARNLTAQRAQSLDDQYKKIVAELSYKNFKMDFKEFPIPQVQARWKAKGKPFYEFVEPIDGFHPSQDAQAEMADVIWEWLESKHPEVLGEVNPNNQIIDTIFKDQGGY